MKFEELNLSEKLIRALDDIGYKEATEIQKRAIPEILDGADLIAQSQTGTGKTAAFGLPLIEKIQPNNKNVQAIILCPTRELAIQISEELRKYTKYTENIKMLAIYGGQAIERQIMGLKKGIQIVIGTPGRVIDHMRRKTLKLANVKMVVLDEADEMLNMGFEEDIETILKEVPTNRQTLLFSATMNPRIMEITKKYLHLPKNIKIKTKEVTVENIEQVSIDMKQGMKDESLTRLIDMYNPKKTIVFCNTKKKVDNLIETLKVKGYKAEALHGDIKQNQRDRIMRKIKAGDIKILVATDVAARGIDIEDLDLVINYDVPQEEEYYVHRIGRTGRNGNSGKAFTFVVGKEKNKIYNIQKFANTKIKQGRIPTIDEVNRIKNQQVLDDIQKTIDEKNYQNTELFEELIKNNDIKEVASALFSMVTTSNVSNENMNKQEVETNGNVKLFFSLGKKDKIMVKDIIGSMAANSAISGTDIGRVNILDKFSFVEVPNKYVEEIMTSMKGKQIKGKNVNIEIANS